MSGQLVSKKEKEDLAKVFKQFDKNNDGMLDREELQEGYAKAGKTLTDDTLDEIFA